MRCHPYRCPNGYGTHMWPSLLATIQSSRLKPSYEFHFEGLSNFSLSVEESINPRRQFKNIEMIRKLVSNFCRNYMVYVYSTIWRDKNQPSNITSCSDNSLHLLVHVVSRLYWGLQVMPSFSNLGCVLKGCFERGVFWRAKSHLKGIEDFKLEFGHHPIAIAMSTITQVFWTLLGLVPLKTQGPLPPCDRWLAGVTWHLGSISGPLSPFICRKRKKTPLYVWHTNQLWNIDI